MQTQKQETLATPRDDLIELLARFEFARADLESVAGKNQQELALKTIARMIDQVAALAERHGVVLAEDLLAESAAVLTEVQQFELRYRRSGLFRILGASSGTSERGEAFTRVAGQALDLLGRFGTAFQERFEGRTASHEWTSIWKTFVDDLRRTLQAFGS